MTISRFSGALLLIIAFVAALAVQAPAGWAARHVGSWLPASFATVDPASTVISGTARAADIRGVSLPLSWAFERWSWRGPVYRLETSVPGLQATARLSPALRPAGISLTRGRATVELEALDPAWRRALFQPMGIAEITLDPAVISDPRAIVPTGVIRWGGARTALAPELDFGTVTATVTPMEGGGMMLAHLDNRGGIARLDGRIEMSLNRVHHVDVLITPGNDAPPALSSFLSSAGQPEGAGWRIRRAFTRE